MGTELVDAMAALDDEKTMMLISAGIASGESASAMLADLQSGINIVGQRFEQGEYFLPHLMLSGQLFQDAQAILEEHTDVGERSYVGKFILGTVKDDIHDIGKNIVSTVLASNGFEVIDVGVDADPQAFVQAIQQSDAKIVGMSCLLTTAFKGIKSTVEAIEEAGLREGRLLLIGGGPVDQSTVEFSGADAVCKTAQDAVRVCREFLGLEA